MNADRTDHYRTIAAVFALALAATAAPLGAQVVERTTGTVLREGVPETYVVKRGDVLGTIARRNGTTVARLKALNGLKSDRIRIGQRLRVR